MKVVAMIPIKMNNERVPNKNIRKFSDGTPLMHFIQNACLKAKLIDEVYVYCSEEIPKDYLLEGVQLLKRPEFLDENSSNCNDIIREFIKVADADIYVVSHATAPFTKSESIDKCVQSVLSCSKYDSSFTVEKILNFMWSAGKPINFDLDKFPRIQDLEPTYIETSGAFVFRKDIFQKYNRRVGINPYLVEVSPEESIDIDTEYDLIKAQAIYQFYKEC